jgi:hypothetical protein
MNIDFRLLQKSIGEELGFEADYILNGNINFHDIFYAYVREVGNDFIIVEQYLIETDDDDNDKIISHKRKLTNGMFKINQKTPINS